MDQGAQSTSLFLWIGTQNFSRAIFFPTSPPLPATASCRHPLLLAAVAYRRSLPPKEAAATIDSAPTGHHSSFLSEIYRCPLACRPPPAASRSRRSPPPPPPLPMASTVACCPPPAIFPLLPLPCVYCYRRHRCPHDHPELITAKPPLPPLLSCHHGLLPPRHRPRLRLHHSSLPWPPPNIDHPHPPWMPPPYSHPSSTLILHGPAHSSFTHAGSLLMATHLPLSPAMSPSSLSTLLHDNRPSIELHLQEAHSHLLVLLAEQTSPWPLLTISFSTTHHHGRASSQLELLPWLRHVIRPTHLLWPPIPLITITTQLDHPACSL